MTDGYCRHACGHISELACEAEGCKKGILPDPTGRVKVVFRKPAIRVKDCQPKV